MSAGAKYKTCSRKGCGRTYVTYHKDDSYWCNKHCWKTEKDSKLKDLTDKRELAKQEREAKEMEYKTAQAKVTETAPAPAE